MKSELKQGDLVRAFSKSEGARYGIFEGFDDDTTARFLRILIPDGTPVISDIEHVSRVELCDDPALIKAAQAYAERFTREPVEHDPEFWEKFAKAIKGAISP